MNDNFTFDQNILSGASSISAINFVTPILYHFLSDGEPSHLFINDQVNVSQIESAIFSSSSRGSLPLPLLIKTERKSITQAYLPLMANNSPNTKFHNAIFSIRDLHSRLLVWLDFNKKLISNSNLALKQRVFENSAKILAVFESKVDDFTSLIDVGSGSLLLIDVFIEALIGENNFTFSTLKQHIDLRTVQEVNVLVYKTVCYYLSFFEKEEKQRIPFGGKISVQFLNKIEEFEFCVIDKNNDIILINEKVNYKLTLIDDKLSISSKSDFWTEDFKLKCTGSLSAELVARLGKAIVAPWYLQVILNQTGFENSKNTKSSYLELISPLKPNCINRRSKELGGNDLRLNPSGYILMDYKNEIVIEWIRSLLRFNSLDEEILRIMKKVSYLNFSSNNNKTNLFSRALTISKYLIADNIESISKNKVHFNCSERIKPIKEKGQLDHRLIFQFIDAVVAFNIMQSIPFNKKQSQFNSVAKAYPNHLQTISMNLLELIEVIDYHFIVASKKKVCMLKYMVGETKMLTNPLFKMNFAKDITNQEIILTLKNIILKINYKTYNPKLIGQLKKFFNNYLTTLILHWNIYNIYCLKASLPNLVLLLNKNDLNNCFEDILIARGATKSLNFNSIWKQSH